MTRERLTELLENFRELSNSLLIRKAEIQKQIEIIWERCHPGGLSYDKDRITATPISYTAKLAGCADASSVFDEESKDIDDQLEELETIRKGIYSLNSESKLVLMKIYLNGYNVSTLALVENKDRNTIKKKRDKAINELLEKINTKHQDSSLFTIEG